MAPYQSVISAKHTFQKNHICSSSFLSFFIHTTSIAWELTSTSKPSNGFSGIRECNSDSLFRDDLFLDFGGFQEFETPIKHAQNLKLIAELNSTH